MGQVLKFEGVAAASSGGEREGVSEKQKREACGSAGKRVGPRADPFASATDTGCSRTAVRRRPCTHAPQL